MGSIEAGWFGVRCVFGDSSNKPWGPYDLFPGAKDYEERVTVWQTDSIGEAIAKAEVEARRTTGMSPTAVTLEPGSLRGSPATIPTRSPRSTWPLPAW